FGNREAAVAFPLARRSSRRAFLLPIYGGVNRCRSMLTTDCCGCHKCERAGKPFPPDALCQYHGAWRANRSSSMSDPEKRNGEGPSTGVIVKAKPKTKKP